MTAQSPAGDDALALPGGREVPAALLRFSAVRSGGPGGQHVNKTATKVQLRIALSDLSPILGDAALDRLRALGRTYLTAGDELVLTCDASRSQRANRLTCTERLRALLMSALARPRVRRKTRPTRASKVRRLDDKARRSKRKRERGGDAQQW